MRSKNLLTLEEAIVLQIQLDQCGFKNVRKVKEEPNEKTTVRD